MNKFQKFIINLVIGKYLKNRLKKIEEDVFNTNKKYNLSYPIKAYNVNTEYQFIKYLLNIE